MQSEAPFPKSAPKGELLRKISQRLPGLDVETLEIIVKVQRLGKSVSALLSTDLEAHGLTEGKFYVLVYLHCQTDGGDLSASPSDIADGLGVTRGTITGLLDGLERDGYVERQHDTDDRRALTVTMTQKARDFVDNFEPHSAIALSKALNIGAQEKRRLLDALSEIESAVESVRCASDLVAS
jgi:DNA-binding MarR family transcriptional regulator